MTDYVDVLLDETEVRFLRKILLSFLYDGPDMEFMPSQSGATNRVSNRRLANDVVRKLPRNDAPLAPRPARRPSRAKPPFTNDR